MKSKIKLVFNNVAEIVGNEQLGLLALTDEAQTMELLIPCDKEMKEQLGLRLNHLPITKMLLPEVLWQLVRSFSSDDFEIIIDGIIAGQYRVLLHNILTLQPIRLVSIIGNIPIYIEASLMARQGTPFSKNATGASLPINILDDKMIENALAKAIKDENYELASRINEEIKRRKDKQK